MAFALLQTIIGGLITSLIWFVVGGVLYMNPLVSKIYKSHENSPGFKKWKNTKEYLIKMFIFGILIQCMLFAFVYSLIRPALPSDIIFRVILFGLILFAVKIIPRLVDMYMQSTYPNKLLIVELVNGTIGSFLIAIILSFYMG